MDLSSLRNSRVSSTAIIRATVDECEFRADGVRLVKYLREDEQ